MGGVAFVKGAKIFGDEAKLLLKTTQVAAHIGPQIGQLIRDKGQKFCRLSSLMRLFFVGDDYELGFGVVFEMIEECGGFGGRRLRLREQLFLDFGGLFDGGFGRTFALSDTDLAVAFKDPLRFDNEIGRDDITYDTTAGKHFDMAAVGIAVHFAADD